MSPRRWARQAALRVGRALATTGIVLLAHGYDLVMKPSPRTVRRLAGSRAARTAREAAERQVRDVVRTYAALPFLELRLLALEDTCSGGGGWGFDTGEQHRISCTLRAAAYYTVSPDVGTALEDLPFVIGRTLTWDTPDGTAVDEVRTCTRKNDPPVHRCLREGELLTVNELRSTYGPVLRLTLHPVTYFRKGR
ncbi:hypothetical protein ACFVXE_00420 [Streptomyces sp. NPDC058231]|uniref:hypothetical protein n=1 Tax=Streptomyces sp. NPDC058231 TaxID=3346392 RepID=UPI0036E5D8F2